MTESSTPLAPQDDPFPPADFDQWAAEYDQQVESEGFPFTGYHAVLNRAAQMAGVGAGQSALDVGAGTGQLAARLAALGCELWCTDFSEKMLAIARAKLPTARLFQHDLRQPFPPELERRFDAIVSAYVFHHFELPQKVTLAARLAHQNLAPGARLVIADLSFPTPAALAAARQSAAESWDEEPYWVASDALPALRAAGLDARYEQVSDCAGIYCITPLQAA